MAASLLTGGVGLVALGTGTALRGRLIRHEASGLTLGYSVDALSGWFLVVLAILGIAVAVYSVGYFAHSSPGRTAFVGTSLQRAARARSRWSSWRTGRSPSSWPGSS